MTYNMWSLCVKCMTCVIGLECFESQLSTESFTVTIHVALTIHDPVHIQPKFHTPRLAHTSPNPSNQRLQTAEPESPRYRSSTAIPMAPHLQDPSFFYLIHSWNPSCRGRMDLPKCTSSHARTRGQILIYRTKSRIDRADNTGSEGCGYSESPRRAKLGFAKQPEGQSKFLLRCSCWGRIWGRC